MADAASPTSTEIKHHITLTDGTTTLGFIAGRIDRDGNFNHDDTAIDRFPLERRAIKTYQGQSKYDDSQWPYLTIAQDDWSGGRGKETFDDDVSRFYDSYRVDTTREGRVILGGLETYAHGYRDIDQSMPGDVAWENLLSSQIYYATPFTSQALDDTNYAADKVELWVKKTGSPTGNISVDLCPDNGGEPDTAAQTVNLDIPTYLTDTVAVLLEFDWTGTETLTDNTQYWIKIYHTTGNSSNYISVAVGGLGGSLLSDDNSSWAAGTYLLYYRVTDADTFPSGFLFEYKRSLYFVSQPDSGNSFLYLNGDRGTADSNSGALTTLEDATKTGATAWTTDEWKSCSALLIAGPGSTERQPWRTISSNDSNTLTVSPAWNVEHTTSTDYVILGSNKWTSMLDLGAYVTDVAVAGDFVYFARGETGTNVLRYQVYNSGAAWATRNNAETIEATRLLSLNDPTSGTFLYLGCNANGYLGTSIFYGQVPEQWGDLYYSLGTLVETNTPWDEKVYANATQTTEWGMTKISLTDTFTTGMAASERFTAVDITEGKKIGFIIRSSIALDANDLQIHMSDTADVGGTSLDVNVPALTAGAWTWAEIAMTPLGNPTASSGHDEIISVGLNVAVDKNANYDIHLKGGIQILSDVLDGKDLPSEARITNMVRYAGNASDPRLNPWVITENAIYEVQTQNSNIVVPLPIGEIENMRSEVSGQASGVNDVYMWFNLKNKLQRYYSRNLDDVGPDRDAGMPDDRKGVPSAIVSHPGRVYLALDGGADEFSSILVYRSNGWHEVYRAPRVGERILSIHMQTLPHKSIDYLWMNMGSDLLWLPVSYNPYLDDDYTFAHEGNLTTGHIYAANHNLIKIFDAIQAYTEVASSNYKIQADYKVDDDANWTAITGNLVVPFTELDISSSTPPTVTGRRIQFRLRFYTNDNAITPLLKAFVLKAYGVDDVKYGIQMPCMLSEDSLKVNLALQEESGLGQYDTVEEALNKVQAWIDAGTPLTQNSPYSIYDSKTVIVDPVASKPTYLNAKDQHEEHLLQLVINEI